MDDPIPETFFFIFNGGNALERKKVKTLQPL